MKYFLINFLLSALLLSKECTYPFQFAFSDEAYYPLMVVSVDKYPSYVELSLKNARDGYVTLADHLPAIYLIGGDANIQKISFNKNLSLHKYKKEIKKKHFSMKIYSSKYETLIFLFKRNHFIGTIILSNVDEVSKNKIFDTLNINSNICSKTELKKLYSKTSHLEINKKLKLLYSMLFVDLKSSVVDEDVVDETIAVLKSKQNIAELSIINLRNASASFHSKD